MKPHLKQAELKTAEAVNSRNSSSNEKDKASPKPTSKIAAGIIAAALAIGIGSYALWPSDILNGKAQLDLVPQNEVSEKVMQMPLTSFQKAALLADINNNGTLLYKFGVQVANGGNVSVDVSGFKRTVFVPVGVMVVVEVPIPPNGDTLNISAPGKALATFRNGKTAFVNSETIGIWR
ncbi:hypothetical protein [Brucella pseudogrignonensis]|uniref:DUF4352 domain-containing protein n=1 Tax=Brucella pseudogrignonensis TaxID=419475 RepID=A0ABU1MEX7_9HYPH|nr:hypothetical protein [Brucella pseudogrignonensis]MDR6434609.1 hypothetical protein [Brucella pseudogrignonensis]